MLSGLNVLAPLGYVAASLVFGRSMVKGTSTGARIGAFFAGYGILRALALIPGIGFLVWFVASIFGIGALTIAAWRAGHGSGARAAEPPVTEPPPSQEEFPPVAEPPPDEPPAADTEPAPAHATTPAPGPTDPPQEPVDGTPSS
jgi:hypothetical protein